MFERMKYRKSVRTMRKQIMDILSVNPNKIIAKTTLAKILNVTIDTQPTFLMAIMQLQNEGKIEALLKNGVIPACRIKA